MEIEGGEELSVVRVEGVTLISEDDLQERNVMAGEQAREILDRGNFYVCEDHAGEIGEMERLRFRDSFHVKPTKRQQLSQDQACESWTMQEDVADETRKL